MIRIFYEDQEVVHLEDKGWFKKNLRVDVVSHKDPNKNVSEVDVPLPMLRGYDIVLRLGKRPQTDLGIAEEMAREKLMDQEAIRSDELERLNMDITDPHHPDYIAPDNYSDETKQVLEETILEETGAVLPVADEEETPVEEVPTTDKTTEQPSNVNEPAPAPAEDFTLGN